MRETDAQMLVTVFGGSDLLVRSLNIYHVDEKLQKEILERFCECVFKRILLHTPENEISKVIDVFEGHRASGRTFDALIEQLALFIPDMSLHIEEEVERAIGEFRIREQA